MAKITYVQSNGIPHTVDLQPGTSVMEGALTHGIPGIDADCGGACSCGTCHVHVDPAWSERVGAPSDVEKAMLDFADNLQPNSRLSCQVKVTEELDGLTVSIPESQR